MPQIVQARLDDLPRFWEHLKREGSELGSKGDVISSPREEPWNRPFDEVEKEKTVSWQKSVQEVGWEKAWSLEHEGEIFGHLQLLHQPLVKTSLHRATLQMGIERAYRGKGYGSKLMLEALKWANSQPSLDWVQLFVFDHNTAAKRLYTKFGFIETGSVQDMFRVYGNKITDVSMVLKLK